ncbi:hypothetical protein D9756_010583 [Leucocoprinus leucothites]|uniref:GmrSD restriction endonucleases N-terminal domain-containing protein n=1 Tax=Leucocoprinus leucothites TaxID=201217 RepID=A0A8H5CUF8_9AGAR|nr:hypothetical protein D9756_010583 [Leucoagaricus leucothites]
MADDEAYSSLSDITSDFENGNGESEVNEVVDGEDVPMDGASDHKSPSKPRGGRRAAGTKKGNKEKGNVVWPEAKQVGLIDSIFRNFYIPPVNFAVSANDDGSEHRICIDGKQRLTSIYRFMLGLARIPNQPTHADRDRKTSEKLWYQDSSSGSRKSRTLLPDKYRRLFANKQIVCVEYMDISDKDEREIFQRVQLGMVLTPAEKLGVLKSPRADFIHHLQSTFFKDADSALTSLAWDRSRGTFRCLATILWCIDRYWQSPRLLANAGTIQQLETYLNSPNSVSAKSKSSITAGFTTLQSMLTSSDPTITLPF